MQKDILIYRPLLIICIIIGHCFGIYNGSFFNSIGAVGYNWYKYMNPLFISFQLYAFVFISGYLYANHARKNAMIPFWSFVWKRFKRLYIPSLFFGILYVLLFDSDLGGGKIYSTSH